jgi:hypothetical protein
MRLASSTYGDSLDCQGKDVIGNLVSLCDNKYVNELYADIF